MSEVKVHYSGLMNRAITLGSISSAVDSQIDKFTLSQLNRLRRSGEYARTLFCFTIVIRVNQIEVAPGVNLGVDETRENTLEIW